MTLNCVRLMRLGETLEKNSTGGGLIFVRNSGISRFSAVLKLLRMVIRMFILLLCLRSSISGWLRVTSRAKKGKCIKYGWLKKKSSLNLTGIAGQKSRQFTTSRVV